MTASFKRRVPVAPEDITPQTMAYIIESVGLGASVTSGQILGSDLYARQVDVTSTRVAVTNTTPVVVYTTVIGGGTIGTKGGVRCRLLGTYLNSSGSSSTFTVKIVFGSTTVYEDASTSLASQTNRTPLIIEFDLTGDDATNAQEMHGTIIRGDRNNAATTGLGPHDAEGAIYPIYGTAAEDSTVNKTLSVTVTHSFNNSNTSYHMNYALLTKIGH